MLDGPFLFAAALKLRRDGALAPHLRRLAASTRRFGGFNARCIRISQPMFLAGAAAWDLVQGMREEGLEALRAAEVSARDGDILGELQDVYRVALALVPEGGAERAAYEARLHELRRELYGKSHAPWGEPVALGRPETMVSELRGMS